MVLSTLRRHGRTLAAVLLILAVAGFFRLWHIGSAPPALFGDEAANGMNVRAFALSLEKPKSTCIATTTYWKLAIITLAHATVMRLAVVMPTGIRCSSGVTRGF